MIMSRSCYSATLAGDFSAANVSTFTKLRIAAGVLAIAATLALAPPVSAQSAALAPGAPPDAVKTGKFTFDHETFGGNGRTCETCHSKKTGTFSIEEAQERFVRNPHDPLFRTPDGDDGAGASFSRLLTTGTIRIDIPLPANVKLVDDPTANTAAFFRATTSARNVTTLQHFLMSDGRESRDNLQHQALEA